LGAKGLRSLKKEKGGGGRRGREGKKDFGFGYKKSK